MATARYTKEFMPFSKVKEKEFLSRPLGCKAVGFSFVRYKPGEGATYVHRHKVQEEVFITLKGTGSIILNGKRISMPEGTISGWVQRFIGPLATTQKRTWSI
jgi:uncharacterized cupin superfamily protein